MKKVLTVLLVAAILTASLAVLASANTEEVKGPYYISVTGVVMAVEEVENGQRVELATPAADRDGKAFINITDRTVFPFEKEMTVGRTITAYYLANAPMILIYPPQYTAAVVVSGLPASTSVNVDRFYAMEGQNNMFLAQSGNLAFRVGDNTEIVLADGQDFSDGNFDGRRIVVIYDVATRSMPPQTTAVKLIVLFEDAVTGPLPLSPEELPGETPITTLPAPVTALPAPAPGETLDASGWPIQVDGTNITAPASFQTADGVLMVPLRAVAEALGYEVTWNGADRSVRLGVAINASIGSTNLTIGRMAPLTLSAAPVLVDGVTFVPLDFFRLIGVNNAYAFEGQIVFDTQNERME